MVGRSTERGFRDRIPGALVGAVAVVAVLVAAQLGGLEAAELSVFDRWVRAFAPNSRADSFPDVSPVVVISLTEQDFERRGYPIPDALLASALDTLASLGASAVGVDLYRPAPASDGESDLSGWAALAAVLERHPQIVWTELLPTNETPGISAPSFAAASQFGFNNMLVDPGIGFGKTVAHNLELLNGLALFHSLGCPIVIGASRKRMIGALSNEAPADRRLAGSLTLALKAAEQGVQIIRVHDVPETVQALKVWRGLRDQALTPRV